MTIDRGFLAQVSAGKPDPEYVIRLAALGFGVTIEALTGRSREHPLVFHRQVAMAAVKEMTDRSYPATGRLFGDRDHTTVMHACRHVRKSPTLSRSLEALKAAVAKQWAIDHGMAYKRSALAEFDCDRQARQVVFS